MRFLLVSDFDLRGSGYQTIAAGLGTEFTRRGHQVAVVGLEYTGDEHFYPFPVIPSDPQRAPRQIRQIARDWKPEAIIISLDLTWHERAIELSAPDMPVYIGIFAVEGGPMIVPSPWAATIRRMDLAYSISEFGAETCQQAGLDVVHLPIGVDTTFWKPLSAKDRRFLRSTLGIEKAFVVITVADNQERKNLPCAIEAVAQLKEKGVDVYHIIVTKPRPRSIGWNLWAEIKKWGMERNTYVMDQSCTQQRLLEFYGIADAFLLTSKAEGLCLPILEAMACGVSSVASATCSIPQMLEGRGLTIEPEYEYTDPFGNTRRQFVSAVHAAEQLHRLVSDKELYKELRQNGLSHTKKLTWAKTVEMLERDLNVKSKEKAKAREAAAEVTPIRQPPAAVGLGTH